MKEGLKKGEIKFFLHGKKVNGSFALVKTKGFARTEHIRNHSVRSGPKDLWLLIKHNDKYVIKDYDAANFDISATSGKSIKEIA